MNQTNLKWTLYSFAGCLLLSLIFQFYMYKNVFNLTDLINDLFLAGLTFFCIGGFMFVIQSGFFDVPVNSIKMFWRSVSKLGRWIRDNEGDEDQPLYDYGKRKSRHPFALSSALIGLFFCLLSFALSLSL
ncbi:DUF3899 domain-containing protein [Pullulanibacillus sp. KACC 23026]|uniref:DUF3899 domain-containing protein n=1 Tax=Pullulanibacillus sp. KACC 23026 TaxID=3028315 RepID=UPI0023AE838B|nr:DUF3899 domain-containing protein [Pullulanibacillus sp. KACC 23026]WEG11927.1 DUF3899 domain-containing protein [Pullulanibacillus sp. KACC 23026]